MSAEFIFVANHNNPKNSLQIIGRQILLDNAINDFFNGLLIKYTCTFFEYHSLFIILLFFSKDIIRYCSAIISQRLVLFDASCLIQLSSVDCPSKWFLAK